MSLNLEELLKGVEKAMETDKEFYIRGTSDLPINEIVEPCKECEILDLHYDFDHEVYLYQEQPFKTKRDEQNHKRALWDMIKKIEELKGNGNIY